MCVGVGLNVIISIITLQKPRHHIFFVSPSGNLFYYPSTIIIIIKKYSSTFNVRKVLKTVIKKLIQWMAIDV